jgi:hypothetical protein
MGRLAHGYAEENKKEDSRADYNDDGDDCAQGKAEPLAGGAVELSCHDGALF